MREERKYTAGIEITIFFNLVLNIHFAAVLVPFLSAKGSVVPEVVWIIRKEFGELFILEKTIRIRNTEEEPC